MGGDDFMGGDVGAIGRMVALPISNLPKNNRLMLKQ